MKARSRFTSILFLLLFLPCAGCRNTELLENELRARDQDIRQLREELARLEFHNESMQREMGARVQDVHKLPPEHAVQLFTVKRITLGRGTAPTDNDRLPGDEGVQVVVEPRDGDDHVLKAPGSIQIQALEINTAGVKTPFSSWDFSADQLRRTWKSGLFSTGYVLQLPWKTFPHQEQIRVIVRFQVLDGRFFEAEKDLRVRLAPTGPHIPVMPSAEGPPAAPPVAETVTPTPGTGPELPLPRKLEPAQETPREPSIPPATGPILPLAHWQAPSLEGAVRLNRPVALPDEP